LDRKINKDPSEVVKIGDKVKVKIIDISNGKVSLSLKKMTPGGKDDSRNWANGENLIP
jgi:ribosomal protein S1